MKDFFKKHNWTIKEMTGCGWFKNKYGAHLSGKITGKNISNAKGVRIYPDGTVEICHFGRCGVVTEPMIFCNAGMFGIYE